MEEGKQKATETGQQNTSRATGAQWLNIAAAAYIIHNITPSELQNVPEGITAGEHLRRLVMAEFGVDTGFVKRCTSELRQAMFDGNLNGVNWSKEKYTDWLKGLALASCNYDAIEALLMDVQNENA